MMRYFYLMLMILLMPGAVCTAEELPGPLTVKEAVSQAIQRNPLMQEADDYVSGALEGVKASRSDFLPKFSMNYAWTGLDQQPIMKTAQGEIYSAHDSQYHWDLSLSQPLFTGYALTAELNLARLGVTDRKIRQKTAALDLARDVKLACYAVLLTRKMQMVAQSEVDSLQVHQEVALRFYGQELIPKNDLLRSEVALANALQSLERAGAETSTAEARLNTLLDYNIDRPVDLEDIDSVPGPAPDPVLLRQKAMESRPEILGLKNGLDQTRQSEKLARSSRYPAVSLLGRYEQNGDEPGGGNNDYANPENASVSLQARWTFFEWGKTRAQVSRVLHERDAIRQRLRAVENQIRFEVKNAFLNLDVASKNIRTAEKSLGQARENFRITNVQYAQQVVTSDIVLDARALLTTADSNYYRALYGYMSELAGLDRAVGKM